jgi:hypothetical protein
MPVEIAIDGDLQTVVVPPEGVTIPIDNSAEYNIDPNQNILMNVQ